MMIANGKRSKRSSACRLESFGHLAWCATGRTFCFRRVSAVAGSPSFWTCPSAHAVFVSLNFARVSTALCATVPRVPLKVIVRASCVEPYDCVGRAMPLRRLFVFKGLHPLTERCADNQQNCYPGEQPVSDTSRHNFPPINYAPRILEAGWRAGIFPRCTIHPSLTLRRILPPLTACATASLTRSMG